MSEAPPESKSCGASCREIASIHHDIQRIHTYMGVLSARLQALEGTYFEEVDWDSGDVRCDTCPHNPDVLPPIPDSHDGPPGPKET